MSHEREVTPERFLRCDLSLHKTHTLVNELIVNDRISVSLYRDDPLFMAIISVDGKPQIKEEMVAGCSHYIEQLAVDTDFMDFLYDYSKGGHRS